MKSLLSQLTTLLLAMVVTSAVYSAESAPRRRVAMIFDDGPIVQQNEKYLALLAKENVRVTFANVGQNVVANPGLTRAAAAAGHEIVNHSYTHPHLKQLDEAAIKREVSETQAAIEKASGKAPAWFWAPFLEQDDRLVAAVRAAGLEYYPIERLRLVSTEDWNGETSAETIRRRATTDIQDRTVILCHEWRQETLAELPAILAELRRQGCEFLTFSELAALAGK